MLVFAAAAIEPSVSARARQSAQHGPRGIIYRAIRVLHVPASGTSAELPHRTISIKGVSKVQERNFSNACNGEIIFEVRAVGKKMNTENGQ